MRARHFKSGMVGSRGGLCSGLFFVQGLKQWTIFLHICMYIPNITVTRRDTFSFVSMFCLPLSLDRVHRMDIFSVKASHHTEIIKTKMTAILRDSRKKTWKALQRTTWGFSICGNFLQEIDRSEARRLAMGRAVENMGPEADRWIHGVLRQLIGCLNAVTDVGDNQKNPRVFGSKTNLGWETHKFSAFLMLQVLVVDEIGTLGEAKAARTIGERGVQLLAARMS